MTAPVWLPQPDPSALFWVWSSTARPEETDRCGEHLAVLNRLPARHPNGGNTKTWEHTVGRRAPWPPPEAANALNDVYLMREPTLTTMLGSVSWAGFAHAGR
jgi:hypothetical protein